MDEDTSDAFETLIPELRESEDERIRKELVQFLTDVKNISEGGRDSWHVRKEDAGMCDSFLTYLEKQKYDRMKPIYDARESFESALEKAWNDYHNGYENVDKFEDDYVECAHAKGFREGYLFGIEKQKEQKPAEWSKEDERIKSCIGLALTDVDEQRFKDFGTTLKDCLNWLKSLRPQPKQEWSEEDKDYYDTIVRKLEVIGDDSGLSSNQIKFLREHYPLHYLEWSEEDERNRDRAIFYTMFYQRNQGTTKGSEECIDWLKSLKPQSKAEWSEEDESELTAVIYCVSRAIKASKDENERNSLLSAKKWLQDKLSFRVKSLRPSWKPSEEQMEELWNVISYIEQPDSNFLGVPALLESLYEQLKKL